MISVDGVSLDRPRAELEEEDGRDDGGQVGIEDGAEGPGEAEAIEFKMPLPRSVFLFDPLEDEDVGVDGHARWTG